MVAVGDVYSFSYVAINLDQAWKISSMPWLCSRSGWRAEAGCSSGNGAFWREWK
jgi:hypothetical protein